MKKLLLLLAMTTLLCYIFVSCSKDDVDETIPVSAVTISEGASFSLTEGATHTFRASVAPSDATNKTVTWSSSASAVVSINAQTGAAEALAAGEATITARAGSVSATCRVTVTESNVPVTSVAISPEQVSALNPEGTVQLSATVLPENATDKSVVWASLDQTVATVSETGLVTAVAVGSTKITATAGEHQDEITITVTAQVVPVTSVAISPEQVSPLNPEGTVQLSATVLPENATDKSVVWASQDQSIATVSETGLVTAVAVGSTKITATAGEHQDEITITVEPAIISVTGVSINNSNILLTVGDANTGTLQLSATVQPATASNKNLTYSIDNSNIATVSESGLLTAVNGGVTKVKVTTEDGSFTDEVTVNVKVPLPNTSGGTWSYDGDDYTTLLYYVETTPQTDADPTELRYAYTFSDHNTYEVSYIMSFATTAKAQAYTNRLWKGQLAGQSEGVTVDYTLSGSEIELFISIDGTVPEKKTQSEVVAQEEAGLVFGMAIMLAIPQQNNGLMKNGNVYYRDYEDSNKDLEYTLYYTVDPATQEVIEAKLEIDTSKWTAVDRGTLVTQLMFDKGIFEDRVTRNADDTLLTIDFTDFEDIFVGLGLEDIISITSPQEIYRGIINLNTRFYSAIILSQNPNAEKWSVQDGTLYFTLSDGDKKVIFGFDVDMEVNYVDYQIQFANALDRAAWINTLIDGITYRNVNNVICGVELTDLDEVPFIGKTPAELVDDYTDSMWETIDDLILDPIGGSITPIIPNIPNIPNIP